MYAQVETPTADDSAQLQVVTNPLVDEGEAQVRQALRPKFLLYTSCLIGLVMPLQFGWSTSQVNYAKFNNVADCNRRPVREGTCIMFPGHTKLEWIFVVNAWILGGMLGALFVGRFADRLGRKKVLQYNCVFIIIGAVLQASSTSLWQFVAGRFFAGLASGATTGNLGSYVNEVAPPHLRWLGVVTHSGITIGILLVATTHFYLATSTGWRIIAGFPIVLAAIFLGLSPFAMVESPVWLLLKGRRAEAESVLARLFGEENVSTALNWIESKRKHDTDVQSTLSEAAIQEPKRGVTLSDLVKPDLRRQFIIAIGLACMQKITGINTIFYYSSDMFAAAGLHNGRVSAILIDIVNMVPTVISGLFTRRFGNRNILIFGTTGMFVSSICLTITLTYKISALSILFMATYVAAFGVSLGPLLYVVIADLFPDYARATVSGLGVFVAWSCNLVVGIGYPYISSALDNLAYVPFAVILFFSSIFVVCLVPETNGKTSEEIQAEFRAIRRRARTPQCYM